MNPKKLPRQRLIGIIYLGLMLMLILVVTTIGKTTTHSKVVVPSTNKVTISTAEQKIIGLPRRIQIPAIGVDATIEYVGLNATGAMDAPKNQDNAAWYQRGIRPGNVGSAVIAGHYGTWDNGMGSVFDNLSKLAKGDRISIVDNTGTTINFVVRETQSYDPQADATKVFTSSDGKSHLNLITCEGKLNISTQNYSSRLVIFSDKE